MQTNLIISGAAGRMGKRLIALASQAKDFNIVAAVDRTDHPDIGKDAGILAGIERTGVELTDKFDTKSDVLIDFSLPEASDNVIAFCEKNQVRLVMATTGLSTDQLESINKLSKTVPVVHASNYSIGMNVLFTLVGKVAQTLGQEYDIEITEAHHRFKKDAPSGTALTLAENIAKETGRDWPDCLVHGREGRDALREKGSIGMHAIRAGDIVGKHSVMLSTLGETLTLSHDAQTRNAFAQGAIRAVRWVMNAKPGLYSMADVLNLTA